MYGILLMHDDGSCPGKKAMEYDLDTEPGDPGHLKLSLEIQVVLNWVISATLVDCIHFSYNVIYFSQILQLEKRLQEQFAIRRSLEKALGYKHSSHGNLDENLMSKPAKELVKDIAVLELEVVYLEQYLLSLYREAYDQQTCSLSPSRVDEKPSSVTKNEILREISGLPITPKENLGDQSSQLSLSRGSLTYPQKKQNTIRTTEKRIDFGIHRSQSSLCQQSTCSTKNSPVGNLDRALRSCHSQPLSFLKHAQNGSTSVISLAEHLGTRISDHIPETSNRLSEDMIKCIAAIYCKLADPSLIHHGLTSSPISSLSTISEFSPQDQYGMWSPQCRKDSSIDSRLDNPFHVEGFKEFSGPYSTMLEVPWIYRDTQRMKDIDSMLQNYRSLVCRLEEVNPRKMKHDEKLAFWMNIHNALVMHTFLAYGIPRNNLKRLSLLLKAAYNVGGQTVTTEMIQSFILGCTMPRPGQWFRLLFFSRTKFKSAGDRQAYAIERSEPLLHFGLCSGSHSDAAVRVYTPKRVFQELEVAKEEYLRVTFGIRRKDQKILLPKIVESFARDSGLSPASLVELIQQCMPETLRKRRQKFQQGKNRKNIEWVSHNFAFRYLISKELIR
ncbi:hypothetical protein GIB67_007424 [Kingdonia uniflora]|uniref:Electron transporter n=1 Tax=Kingdonia uniflora TaxID=39325 RepID=A0A7J7MLS0_9MAGN|nr:hypothetical protein GIB67_007424 [Kingdonia uniflora]